MQDSENQYDKLKKCKKGPKSAKKIENLGQKLQNCQKFGFFNDFWDTFWNFNNFSYIFDGAKFDPGNDPGNEWFHVNHNHNYARSFKIGLLKIEKFGKIAENLENFKIF